MIGTHLLWHRNYFRILKTKQNMSNKIRKIKFRNCRWIVFKIIPCVVCAADGARVDIKLNWKTYTKILTPWCSNVKGIADEKIWRVRVEAITGIGKELQVKCWIPVDVLFNVRVVDFCTDRVCRIGRGGRRRVVTMKSKMRRKVVLKENLKNSIWIGYQMLICPEIQHTRKSFGGGCAKLKCCENLMYLLSSFSTDSADIPHSPSRISNMMPSRSALYSNSAVHSSPSLPLNWTSRVRLRVFSSMMLGSLNASNNVGLTKRVL